MKRILCLLLVLTLIFTLVACSNEEVTTSEPDTSIPTAQNEIESTDSSDIQASETNTIDENSSVTETPGNTTSTDTSSANTGKPTTSSKPSSSSTPSTNKPSSSTENTSKPSTPTHTHSYSKKVTVATCTEKGYTTYTCSCGDTYKDNFVDPKCNFSNYKCTICKKIQDGKVFEYFKSFIKSKGTVDGDCVQFRQATTNNSVYSITYYPADDLIYMSNIRPGKQSGDTYCFMLKITANMNKYQYTTVYAEGNYQTITQGFIIPKDYTTNSPLPAESYSGDSKNRNTILELNRIASYDLLEYMEMYLEYLGAGITIADLGFTSF